MSVSMNYVDSVTVSTIFQLCTVFKIGIQKKGNYGEIVDLILYGLLLEGKIFNVSNCQQDFAPNTFYIQKHALC